MKIKNGHFISDGQPFFVYSGEVHYFRIAKKDWPARLGALKRAGFNGVSTYIPWIWHEPGEGEMDFTGRTVPERDVLGFIDLAKKMKLAVSARVGPVSNAELVNEGLPPWLLKNYPEIFVTGRRDVGNLPHVTIISYLHPTFQKKVAAWYGALVPDIVSRQSTRGGNVMSVQLCNEIAMVHWLQKGADHKEHVTRMFRGFLEEKYKTIDALNAAHKTTYGDFEQVFQPSTNEPDPTGLSPHVDWALFYRHYYATYYFRLAEQAKALGIDVPLLCNIPQFYDYDIRGRGNWAPMTTSMFRDVPLLTPNIVFGGAYQMRHLDFENFHDVSITTEVTRMLGAVAVQEPAALPREEGHLPPIPKFVPLSQSPLPVVCAELQTGIMRDRPRLYPQQVALNVKSSTGQGLSGINAYMFAGGENPLGLGAFGTYHDWQAPIGPNGEERPHLAPLKEFGRFLKWAGPHLAPTKKSVDTTLGFYFPYYATEYWAGSWNDAMESQRTNLWYDGMARLIHLAGYSVACADIQRSSLECLLEHKSLWVYSLGFMDHDTQVKLAAYVKKGGALFLGPSLPQQELAGATDTTLADELGLSVVGRQKGNLLRSEGKDFWVQGPVQMFGAKTEVRRWVDSSLGPAVIQAAVGQGNVLVVGFGVPHVFDHFRHWVRQWGESLGIVPQVQVDPWDLQASWRVSDRAKFLFLFNYHFTKRRGSVSLPCSAGGQRLRLPQRGTLTLPPLSAMILPMDIPIRAGVELLYSTAEILDLTSSPRGVKTVLQTFPGAPVDLAFRLSRKPRVTGGARRPSVRWARHQATISIHPKASETKINIVF